jgi:hypothetical protein
MRLALTPAVDVYPDFGGVGGKSTLTSFVGALLTITLIVAVFMLVVCAITWAIAASHGNHAVSGKARTGMWVCVGAVILAGAAVGWLNFLLSLGTTL